MRIVLDTLERYKLYVAELDSDRAEEIILAVVCCSDSNTSETARASETESTVIMLSYSIRNLVYQ